MSETYKSNKRILIADDDSTFRAMLHSLLIKWGYEVVTAANGLEALRVLESCDGPPLAILDWMMPGIEGPRVCQRVREHLERPYVYVVLLTGRNQREDVLEGLDSGADDYLTKPFDAEELRARLRAGQRILDFQKSQTITTEELFFRATHDGLTGIANRDVALDALRREHARQLREGNSFGVILADLDHFKYINDRHGHLCGDAVLKEAAQRMLGCTRPYDTVGRYGGEEFLIVVPSSGALGPFGLAERMRRALECKSFLTDAGEVNVTGSFGVAVCSEEYPYGAEELLRLADDALYRAKEHRNRSELANSSAVGPVSAITNSKSVGRDWPSRAPWNEVRRDNSSSVGPHRMPIISVT